MKRSGTLIVFVALAGGLLLALLVGAVQMASPVAAAQAPDGGDGEGDPAAEPTAAIPGEPPGYPRPVKPIPYHEPGHLARSSSYTTEVVRSDEQGVTQTVTISGTDALAADTGDPLAGNHTLVALDQILVSGDYNGTIQTTYTGTLTAIPGGQQTLQSVSQYNDVASGDLNGDGQAEQILAYLDLENRIHLQVGLMPGAIGRTTSPPAVVAGPTGELQLFVRGYDEALWRTKPGEGAPGPWDTVTRTLRLSGPAIADRGEGQLSIAAIGEDNQVYISQLDTDLGPWSKAGQWPYPAEEWFGAVPEYIAPAAVARGQAVDVFRVAPDGTLRWNHSSDGGESWGDWQAVDGMLSEGVAAVSTAPDRVRVFGRGADGALWWWTHVDGAGPGVWQSQVITGMGEGVYADSPLTVAKSGSGSIRVFVRGSDGRPYWVNCAPDGMCDSSWSAGQGALASAPAAAWRSDHYELYAQMDDGRLQQSSDGQTWTTYGGIPECCVTYDTGLTAQPLKDGGGAYSAHDFTLDVETGHFLGNARSQIVLAYRAQSGPGILALLEALPGLQLRPVGEPLSVDGPEWIRIAVGDFIDRDGVDEVGLGWAYHSHNPYGDSVVYSAFIARRKVVAGTVEGLELVANENQVEDYYSPGFTDFAGTLQVAAGDLDHDGGDELAMSLGTYATWDTGFPFFCPTYQYRFLTRIYDVVHGPTAGVYDLRRYYIEQPWETTAQRNADPWTPALVLAIGDLEGDGQDELIRTVPGGFREDTFACLPFGAKWSRNDRFWRVLKEWKLPTNPDIYQNLWDPDNDGVINSVPEPLTIDFGNWDWHTSESYADRLAVGDIDQDLAEEIVWYEGSNGGSRHLRAYDYVEKQGFTLVGWPSVPWLAYPDLITGAFTGEGLHLGRPTYRVQKQVNSLVALINMPPKHRDLVKVDDGNGQSHYELFEVQTQVCSPSPTDPRCSNAKHATSTDVKSEMQITNQRDWAVGAGLTFKGQSAGTFVDVALKASYGDYFENAAGTIDSRTFDQAAIASTHDQIVYLSTPYQVWEYPTFAAGTKQPQDYLTVVFPVPEFSGDRQVTRAAQTTTGDLGEPPWYRAGHQTYNAWSYDPMDSPQDVLFPDYAQQWEIFDAVTAGGNWYSFKELASSAFVTTTRGVKSISSEIGVGYETPKKLRENTGSSLDVRVSVNGSYKDTDIETEKTETTNKTDISLYIAPVDDIGSQFTTRAIGYWARDKYLVLDYQTNLAGWKWAEYYKKPDPAFILPWYSATATVPLKLFSPDITVMPAYADLGETVTISATLRNFSNHPASKVLVRFCVDDPGAGCAPGGPAYIGDASPIASLDRRGGPVTVSTTWDVEGAGERRIYAVIDPNHTIDEVHDEQDLYTNNNVAYGVVTIGAARIIDPGTAKQREWQILDYNQGPQAPGAAAQGSNGEGAVSPALAAYVPAGNLSEVVTFALSDAGMTLANSVVKPFAFVAYAGEGLQMRRNADYDFALTPPPDTPPAAIGLTLPGVDIAGLKLYRATTAAGTSWEEANCGAYQTYRFPEQGRIVAPVCETGVFVFAETTPLPPNNRYLPLIRR